jgi:hypothetical protein
MRSSFITDDDPLSARVLVENRATYRRGDWDVRVETDVEMTKGHYSPSVDSPGPPSPVHLGLEWDVALNAAQTSI